MMSVMIVSLFRHSDPKITQDIHPDQDWFADVHGTYGHMRAREGEF